MSDGFSPGKEKVRKGKKEECIGNKWCHSSCHTPVRLCPRGLEYNQYPSVQMLTHTQTHTQELFSMMFVFMVLVDVDIKHNQM